MKVEMRADVKVSLALSWSFPFVFFKQLLLETFISFLTSACGGCVNFVSNSGSQIFYLK